MLYAWIDDQKRAPLQKGERTSCRDCGGILTSVIPVENTPHWRHRAGDCDTWSEPEGPWHLDWKEQFDISCREIALRDEATGELHRADVLVNSLPKATVLELQHSPISESERIARESYYMVNHRMFWLVHIHNANSFLGYNFFMSLDFQTRPFEAYGRKFAVMNWIGSSKQFIEKWKRSNAHVFFQAGPHIFYLVGAALAERLGRPLGRGEFALSRLSHEEFVRAVHGRND